MSSYADEIDTGVPQPGRRAFTIAGAIFVFLLLVNLVVHAPSVVDLASPFRVDVSAATIPVPGDEPLVFTMVMFGAASAREGQYMMKSILMHTSRAVQLHIICSQDAISVLEKPLSLVSRPSYNVEVFYYPITVDAIKARAQRAGVASRHHAGWGGLVKIFMHELLPIERALYVDTDAMFAVDPALLWRSFAQLHRAPEQIALFPTAGVNSTGASICSCVMALHLQRMRSARVMSSTLLPGPALSDGAWAIANVDPLKPSWGDQSLLYALWRTHPARFGDLAHSWDLTACRSHYGVTLDVGRPDDSEEQAVAQQRYTNGAPDELEVLFPGIVHFNCQKGEGSIFESEKIKSAPAWGLLVRYIFQYKWVWLNRGDGSARVAAKVVSGVLFEDERLAAPSTSDAS